MSDSRDKFKDNVIIITGATSGMGKGIAESFARQGASLILSGRNEERGTRLVKELKDIHKNILFVPADIRLPEANKQLVEAAISSFGKIN